MFGNISSPQFSARIMFIHKAQKQLLTKAAARGTAILLLFSVRAVRELNEGRGTSFKYYDEEDVSPERDVCKWRRFSKIFLDSKTFLWILAPRTAPGSLSTSEIWTHDTLTKPRTSTKESKGLGYHE